MRSALDRLVPALALAGTCLLPLYATAELNATVQITLSGEVITEGGDPGRPGEIPIIGYGEGNSTPYDPASGLATGARRYRPISFTKEADKSTPKLHEACSNGTHLDEVVIRFYSSPSDPTGTEYYKITMTNVLISSYQTGGSSGDIVPVDTISLNFGQIEWTHTDVSGPTTATDSWDAGGAQ